MLMMLTQHRLQLTQRNKDGERETRRGDGRNRERKTIYSKYISLDKINRVKENIDIMSRKKVGKIKRRRQKETVG